MPRRCPSVKSCVFEGASPPNSGADGEVVGVGDSVHLAFYRGQAAGTEDIINANTERTFLIGVAQPTKTALQKAITHAPTNLAIHIRQRNGIEVTYRQHRIGRGINRRFHRFGLLLAQFTGIVELLAETALLEMADGQRVQLQVFLHETKTL